MTFTENAATTLKLRLRERLERARADARAARGRARARCAAALEMLERAQVSTIHALCAAILQERPLECGVVPGFRIADEAEADLLFAEAWEEWLHERLAGGDEVLLEALDQGIPLEAVGPWGERSALRGLARTLVDQRDLRPLVAAGRRPMPRRFRDRAAREGGARAGAGRRAFPTPTCWRRGSRASWPSRRGAAALDGTALCTRTCGDIATIPKSLGFKPRWPSDEALAGGAGHRGLDPASAKARWSSTRGAALHGAPGPGPPGRGADLRAEEGRAGRARLPRPPGEGARRPARPRVGAPALPRALPRS